MATLNPPTPAFRQGPNGTLDTRVPWHLRARGFKPSWPAGAEVFGVAGVPSDATVPAGTTVAQDTTTKKLYRRETGQWKPVAGE